MRGTLHALPVPDASVAHAATLPQRQAASAARLARRGLGGATQRRLASALKELLEQHQQMTLAEMTQALSHSVGADVVVAIVRDLWENGVILAWDSAGNPHRRQRTFCLANTLKEWERPDVTSAMDTLLRGYLRAYGPASFGDIAWWTGWGTQRTARTCKRLEHELLPVRVAGLSADLVALSADEEFLRRSSATQPGAQVLAYEDPAIKAYYETRRRYLADRCAVPALFWHAGESLACVWITGIVVATWRWDAALAAVHWEPTCRLSKTERDHAATALRMIESYLQAQLQPATASRALVRPN